MTKRAVVERKTVSRVIRELLAESVAAPRLPSISAADRAEIRQMVRLSDREREAYYFASLANIVAMWDSAHRAS